MKFGDDLKDQLSDIDRYTRNGISFLDELREYANERSQLEREYASKIEKLAKTYVRKLKKTGNSLYGFGTALAPAAEGSEQYSSCAKAVLSLWNEAEAAAKARLTFAEHLATDVVAPLKFEAKRKEDARVKHLQFAQNLAAQVEAARDHVEKTKDAYRKQCQNVEAAYLKYERAVDPQSAKQMEKEWNDALLEKKDRQNDYLLALSALRALRHQHIYEYMPTLMNHMQDLNEHIAQRAFEVLNEIIHYENECLEETRRCNDQAVGVVNQIQGQADSDLFISVVKRDWQEPPVEEFAPYSSQDVEALATDQPAVLLNVLANCLAGVAKCDDDIAAKQKEIDGLKTLKNQYDRDRSFGDPVEVWQNVIESERASTLIRITRLKHQAQIDTIRGVLGDVSVKKHTYKSTTSGSCAVCSSSLSLFSKGLGCTECKVKVHVKCSMRLPPACGSDLSAFMQAAPAQTPTSLGLSRSNTTRRTGTKARGSSISSSSSSASVSTPVTGGVAYAVVQFDFESGGGDELTVKVGDRLKVIEADDGNGWLRGELNGVVGVVPATYVEIQEPVAAPAPDPVPALPSRPRPGAAAASPAALPRVRVLYDYDATVDLELTIREGDVIEVLNKDVGDGWWEGRLNGKVGQFPLNYVEEI